jgi:adenosylcobyric acid synthase
VGLVRGALLVCGTASDAGKSLVTAGICRSLARRGVRVAPFKAQNMSNNSAVTATGAEIGRAQAMQAAACGIEPEAAMNPVLIKPEDEASSQVLLMGTPYAGATARSYQGLAGALRQPVLDALDSLRARFDVVVCEGAGSPAEINLRERDLANMGLARAAGLPVLLVGDIDRGGVFASLVGTLAVLDAEDQRHVAAFLINKFRGDPTLLAPGLEMLSDLTGRRAIGVLPWREGLWLDAEDSLALEAPALAPLPPAGRDTLEVAVVRLRRMSNFTDLDALAAEPGVAVRYTRSAAAIERADLVVIPGTKTTVADLASLRADGLDVALARRAGAGGPTLGICGGYQLLGDRIEDDVESRAGVVDGLGLLPVETVFAAGKLLRRQSGTAAGWLGGPAVTGYEIRHGDPRPVGGAPLLSTAAGEPEGCVAGAVLGTSWHGLLEGDAVRRALLAWVAGERGRDWRPGDVAFSELRERRLDILGDLVDEHVDREALDALLAGGAPVDLPTLDLQRITPHERDHRHPDHEADRHGRARRRPRPAGPAAQAAGLARAAGGRRGVGGRRDRARAPGAAHAGGRRRRRPRRRGRGRLGVPAGGHRPDARRVRRRLRRDHGAGAPRGRRRRPRRRGRDRRARRGRPGRRRALGAVGQPRRRAGAGRRRGAQRDPRGPRARGPGRRRWRRPRDRG